MAEGFIQWKGTDVCMDFNCSYCGFSGHIDGMFMYNVKCPECGEVFKMPSYIYLERLVGKEKEEATSVYEFKED